MIIHNLLLRVSGCYACSAILWIKDDIFSTLFSIHSRGQAIFYYNSGHVEVYSYNVWSRVYLRRVSNFKLPHTRTVCKVT